MKLSRTQLLIAVALSMAVHVAGAAIFTESKQTIEIAGGAATSELLIGNAFADSLMAGETGEVLKPVEAPLETLSVEAPEETLPVTTGQTAFAEAASTLTFATSDPSVSQKPVKEELSSLIEAVPTRSEELASIPAVSEIEPTAEQDPKLVLPENVPVPMKRPALPETRIAKSEAPANDRQKAKQAKAKTSKLTNRKPQPATSKPSNAGDGGKKRKTASKASSGTATAKRTSSSGNAAVSNYPGKVASKLRRALRYPSQARRQRIRGDVVVSFVVKSNGGVSSIQIAKSSGFPVLDEAAKDAVRRAAPFPSIPADAGRATWPFAVPLGFTR